jgi:hypothetical protein
MNGILGMKMLNYVQDVKVMFGGNLAKITKVCAGVEIILSGKNDNK